MGIGGLSQKQARTKAEGENGSLLSEMKGLHKLRLKPNKVFYLPELQEIQNFEVA